MNIMDVSIGRLHAYENNPRNNDLAVEKVKYSIERLGFLFPIIVDMNFVIVCGHTRVRACRELGLSSVPCIIVDELTEEQVNLFRLIDNKTSEYSSWDFEKFKSELATVDLTIEENRLLLERFELTAEVFDIEPEQVEIKVPMFEFMDKPKSEAGTICLDMPEEETTETFETDDWDAEELETDEAIPLNENVLSEEAAEPPKKSGAILQFCQFRFGDVAFFISQVELDRINKKYAEYIDSGAILEESFVDYLLKGVENSA